MIPRVMDHLNRLIRSLERGTRILKKLLFIRYRYDGDSVETAAGRIQGPYTEMSQKGPVKDVA